MNFGKSFLGERFQVVVSNPLLSRLRAIASPIIPRPNTATFGDLLVLILIQCVFQLIPVPAQETSNDDRNGLNYFLVSHSRNSRFWYISGMRYKKMMHTITNII